MHTNNIANACSETRNNNTDYNISIYIIKLIKTHSVSEKYKYNC